MKLFLMSSPPPFIGRSTDLGTDTLAIVRSIVSGNSYIGGACLQLNKSVHPLCSCLQVCDLLGSLHKPAQRHPQDPPDAL
jgi:hypothetical protein